MHGAAGPVGEGGVLAVDAQVMIARGRDIFGEERAFCDVGSVIIGRADHDAARQTAKFAHRDDERLFVEAAVDQVTHERGQRDRTEAPAAWLLRQLHSGLRFRDGSTVAC